MTTIIYIIIAAVVGLAAGYIVRKQVGESKIKSAEEEAARIMEEATRNTDAIRKEAILEAKDEAYKIRNEAEQEVKERRAELQRSEKRLIQKEEALDRKTEALEQKELNMQKTEAQIEKMEKYTTNFGMADANRAYQLGNNVLVHYVGSQKCMYFIPELGAGFILQDVEKVSSPLGSTYYANNTSVSEYGDKLAITNFGTGMFYDFFANSSFFNEVYPPVEEDPMQKLYIFETD